MMARTAADAVRRIGIRLAALAQDGLTYAPSEYDLDRYRQVGQLAAELLAVLSGRPAGELAAEHGRDSGYATPKIDVRGAVFDDRERALLKWEKTDGRWSLPGGWADPGEPPSVAVTGEILEETGYYSSAVKLIACWDRELQDNPPPLPVHVYTLTAEVSIGFWPRSAIATRRPGLRAGPVTGMSRRYPAAVRSGQPGGLATPAAQPGRGGGGSARTG